MGFAWFHQLSPVCSVDCSVSLKRVAWLWSPDVSPPFVGAISWNSAKSLYSALLLCCLAEMNRSSTALYTVLTHCFRRLGFRLTKVPTASLREPGPAWIGGVHFVSGAAVPCWSVLSPLETHSKRALETHSGRKIWGPWSFPGFYVWQPDASDPEKLDSVLTFSELISPSIVIQRDL